MQRWSILIDVEGFSNIYAENDGRALQLLGNLLDIIWRIGRDVYPDETNRLFIHQYGDGFAIVSNFPEENLTRPLSIAIVIMQIFLTRGGTARVGISDGDFADVVGCYPQEVREEIRLHGGLRIGAGLFNHQQVMGNAFINAYRLSQRTPKRGPLLFVDGRLSDFVNREIFTTIDESDNKIEINWLSSTSDLITQMYDRLDIESQPIAVLQTLLRRYLNQFNLTGEWARNSESLMAN